MGQPNSDTFELDLDDDLGLTADPAPQADDPAPQPDPQAQEQPDSQPADTQAADQPPAEPDPQPAPIDWSKIDPESIPHEIASRTAAFRGVLSDKQRLQDERGEILALARRQAQQPPQAEPKDDPNFNPEEILTAGQLREREVQLRAEIRAEVQRDLRSQQVAASERALLADPAMQGWPDSLKPSQVLSDGWQQLQQLRPGLAQAILTESDDPAREGFKAVLQYVPAYRQAYESHRRTRTATPTSTRTPTAPPAASPRQPVASPQDMSLLDRLVNRTPMEAAAQMGTPEDLFEIDNL